MVYNIGKNVILAKEIAIRANTASIRRHVRNFTGNTTSIFLRSEHAGDMIMISNTTSANIFVDPTGNQFQLGDYIKIFNYSDGYITLTQNTGANLHLANLSAYTANAAINNLYLHPKGYIEITHFGANNFVVAGTGVSSTI